MPHGPFRNYPEAERLADEIAGDHECQMLVIEDFGLGDPEDPDNGEFLVMPPYESEKYLKEHDSEVKYDANHNPPYAL